MELGFKETEAIFAARYGLTEPSIAFRGRLQHLQRGEFPKGVNTGKGKKAVYGWSQLTQLGVALDLIEVGLTPDVAKRLVQAELEQVLRGAASIGVRLSEAELMKAATSHSLSFAKSVFVITSARALSSLAKAESEEDQELDVISGTALIAQIRGGNPYAASMTYIDLGIRTVLILSFISRFTARELGSVVADFQTWASDNVINP